VSAFGGRRLHPVPANLRPVLVSVALVTGAVVLAFSVRMVVVNGPPWWAAAHRVTAAATAPMPSSPPIEDAWGLRFTAVQLLADNGLVEMRYVILDNTKANRLHADSGSPASMPTIQVEGSGKVVKSNSLLFHIHHEWDQGGDGRSYSIVYGNAGGVLYRNALVTIVMADGLKLQHIPVRG
jgi:hypothetical protein